MAQKINRMIQLLFKTSRLHYRLTFAKMSEQGIPIGAPSLLRWIGEHQGCRHKDLACNCHLEPATVTSALLTMEKEGLIHRETDPVDRRSICLSLTPKGTETLERAGRIFHALEEAYFEGFSEEEKRMAEKLLEKLTDNMIRFESREEAKR